MREQAGARQHGVRRRPLCDMDGEDGVELDMVESEPARKNVWQCNAGDAKGQPMVGPTDECRGGSRELGAGAHQE